MKPMIQLLTLLLTGNLAHAGDFRDAAMICESMSFNSSKSQCFSIVRQYDHKYFDTKAIPICEGMSFDSGKLQCVQIIAGKTYEYYETQNCSSLSFDSQKNSCLTNSGAYYRERQHPRVPPRNDSSDLVRGRTEVWENAGIFTAPKAITEKIILTLNTNKAVTELLFTTKDNTLRVVSAYAITYSGQHVRLQNIEGTYGKGSVLKKRLDPNYAIRLREIVLEITSDGLIGSRAKTEILIGLTR